MRTHRIGPAHAVLFVIAAALASIAAPGRAWAQVKPPAPVPPKPASQTARPPAAPPTRVVSVEGLTEYRLANGLRVLLFPDPTKQSITVNVTYLVGSRHENYGETGMAHLLEHLMFKGSVNHPNAPKELGEHGGNWNGTTWTDRTNYFETVPASEENLKWALAFEADRMVHAFIAKKDLDSEFTVVRNEMESGENSPVRALNQRVTAAAFDWHSYGKDTIGARSDVEGVPIDRLKAFYQRYYQPDNAVAMVTGRIDERHTLALVTEVFGAIPKPTRVLPKFYTAEPTQDGEREVTVARVGDIQVVNVAHHIPSGSHPDFAALEVLSEVLGNTPNGRLYKALVETRKATSVSAYSDAMYDPSLTWTGAQLRKDGSLGDARAAILQVVEDVIKNPPTAEEVDRARTRLLKQIDLELAASDEIGLDMSEYMAQGDWRLFFLRRDRIRNLKTEDVARVAAAYLKPSNRTVGTFVPTAKPDRAIIPPRPDVAKMLEDYTGGKALAAGEAFDPAPANIETRTTRKTTPGGMKLALLTKKTRGGKVFANLQLHLGSERDLSNKPIGIGAFTGSLLLRGTSKHTRQQLQDEFDKLSAQVNVSGGPAFASASIETSRDNLPAVLRLVAEVLRDPAFPATEVEQARLQQIQGLENQRQQPGSVASLAMQRHLDPYPVGHPRHVYTIDERLAALRAMTVDEVKQFYYEFYGADVAELAVVGDFDPDAMSGLAEQLFSGWKSKHAVVRLTSLFGDPAPVNQSFETPDKANANFYAGMNLALRQDDPDYPALVLANYMIGGDFNSRLTARVRQKEGLSYGISSSLGADVFDKSGSFTIFAIAAPENIARVENAVKEELARAIKDGFSAEELKVSKQGWLQSREVTRTEDFSIASSLRAVPLPEPDIHLGC